MDGGGEAGLVQRGLVAGPKDGRARRAARLPHLRSAAAASSLASE